MTIGSEIQALLPEVLTDYLCRLFDKETQYIDAALVKCTLSVEEKGGRPIQSIEFWGKRYEVFGFPPVACKLLVLLSPMCSKLCLAS